MEDSFRFPTARFGEPDTEQTPPLPPPVTPNHIPKGERLWNGVLSVVLLAYGVYGVSVDDIYIPGKRGHGMHFHGLAAWITFGAMVAASANLVSVIVDHYDRRNNETNYRRFARATQGIGIALFIGAMFVQCSTK